MNMGLASFNRMRRLQAEALNSTATVVAENAPKPQAAEPADAAMVAPGSAAEALALAAGNFMAFKSAAKKVLGDALPAKKPEIVAALEALADGDKPVNETPQGVPTPIPEAWEAMTDEEMIVLAKALSGGDVASGEAAKAIIQAELTARVAKANG